MSKSSYRDPGTAEELTEHNVRAMRHLDDAAARHETPADRAAARIANWCGRIQFVWLHVAWFGGWIAFNSLPMLPHFDPYPFTFLVLVVSLEAIFLSTFVLMSQNHEARITERRNKLDLQINLLTEQENTKALQLLARIADKLGVEDASGGLAALEQATRPESLARQIDQAYPEERR
ncbi:DUF1003 domain-containing protein [Pseudorhodoferax soli]|uniref:Putative membrane protein n=1 Tax=Pseudorhodoferax soli TaxID=545864 RepID=A0A368XBJ4_9BURK|nr:DUF1003 domain-containing protein [Pseudorhodoferax soli]RCW65225.1 putative membrane protein [Pseudorhodoferax soli]